MNEIVQDMLESSETLAHYGILRRSGRYPWGSGNNPYQRTHDFLSRVETLRKSDYAYIDEKGRTYKGDTAIAKSMGLSTTEFRVKLNIANQEKRSEEAATARALRDKGYSLMEIARRMGYANDSSIRNLLNEDIARRQSVAQNTADIIRKEIDSKGIIDIGAGVEKELGISREKLNEALAILREEGYEVYGAGVPQVTNKNQQTNIKVICPPGTEHKDIYNFENIHSLRDYISYDQGDTFRRAFEYPSSLDSKRLEIKYAEEGGIDKDGVIELRRGVDDISLGTSRYAQVRIMVDGTHYLKGMAVYADDLPDGVDVRFNTNKTLGTPTTEVLKKIKDDPQNPFGSLIKEHGGQSYYDDPNGKYVDANGKRQSLSLINKRADEGDWGEWADKLPSQFLSKQTLRLASNQLNMTLADRQAEFEEIVNLTNPTVRKHLLQSFSDDCDAAAVHLKAAALPRQKFQVIMPMTTIKDDEVYAPNYENGETVALIRYPHGGRFEIPILKVNNKLPEGKRVLGNTAKDAVGINNKVAAQLSGADFDGDTVMIVPCNSLNSKVFIKAQPPLKELEGFDPKMKYGGKAPGTFKAMTKENTQKQMGEISNLITDMTLKGANDSELARAVKHSMVVIDAEKHKLDYKQSEKDNGIKALKQRYQGHIGEDGRYHEGASTLISRAKSDTSVLKRQGSPKINPETGEKEWKLADDLTYVDRKTGKTVYRTQKSTKMAETDDARTLISDKNTPMEGVYANYANKMKALANQARLAVLATPNLEYSPTNNKKYAEEVKSLESKLKVAELNAPRERQAQIMANAVIASKKLAYPDLTKKEIKKISQQALTEARIQVGAKKEQIKISDKEWEAIQAGAITDNKLKQIIKNADIDVLRQKAMPRQATALSTAKKSKIKAMEASGYSTIEIAKAVGVSVSTVSEYLD